jgi:HEAT repeat protein
MSHRPIRPIRDRLVTWLALLAACGAPAAAAHAQDPLSDLKKSLLERPAIDPLLPADKQQLALKKFYEEREQRIAKIVETRLKSFGELRQALMLKEWGDVAKTQREDPEIMATDARLRFLVAQKFQARVQAVIANGAPDSQAAAANLITEMGLTVRAVVDPNKKLAFEERDRALRSGFARVLTDDVIRLTNAPNEFVQLHALRALGGMNPDPKRAAAVFAAKLSTADDVKIRRVAADGYLRLITIANYLKDQTLKSPNVWANDQDVLDTAVAVVRNAPAGLNDSDAAVRASCADALRACASVLAGYFQRPPEESKTLAPLARPYSPTEVALIKELLKAFDDAGPRIARALEDTNPDVRLFLTQGLERLSDARYRLGEEPVNVGAFGKVQQKILLVPPQASDPLSHFAKGDWRAVARLLSDPEVRVRRAAVNFLEFFPEARPAVVPDLVRSLCDSDKFVRWSAAQALGFFTKNYQPKDVVPAVPGLAKALFDNDVTVRLAAAATLESLGPYAAAAVPELARAVHYADVENRMAALYVLQSIGPELSKAAIPSIVEAMDNSDARVRRAAADTLGRYGALARIPTVIEALRRALGDDDQEVRINASEAMLQILSGDMPGRE